MPAFLLLLAAHQAEAAERLSPFTATMFTPDGEITEFISFPGLPQEYFVTNSADPNFGAIKAGATLTKGVFVRRDEEPVVGQPNSAGFTGFEDRPGLAGAPTGFNVGRVFVSYNPYAYDNGLTREGAYFVALDISAPPALDTINGTLPQAFDLDGNGSRLTQTEQVAPNTLCEAPTLGQDIYTVALDVNLDGSADIEFLIGERRNTIPFGSVAIDPGGVAQIVNCGNPPMPVTVRRFVQFTDGTGFLGGDPTVLARLFLDSNDDGVLDHQDFGIGNDVEFVIRNLRDLHLLLDANNVPDTDPACVGFRVQADTFDDVSFAGGAEDRVFVDVTFPVPDLEVVKEARCADDPVAQFSDKVNAAPGSEVEFRITVQNRGNVPLDVAITDALSCMTPATASLVPGSCVIDSPPPADRPPPVAGFCTAFENALNSPAGFPLSMGTFEPGSECEVETGDSVVFRFRVTIGPSDLSPAQCDRECTNSVSVTGNLAGGAFIDPILEPFRDDTSTSNPDDAEEENCANGGCCAGAAGCTDQTICDPGVPARCVDVNCINDPCEVGGNGDVRDEFTLGVSDEGGVIDTFDEADPLPGSDDNEVVINLRCRDLTFDKQVRLRPSGPFQSGNTPLNVPGDAASFPLELEYRYSVVNNGDQAENITINDAQLCADVTAAGATLVACPLCPVGTVNGVVAGGGGSFVSSCIIRFANATQLLTFTGLDDARPATCGGAALTHRADELCHVNCASLHAEFAAGGGAVCDLGADLTDFSTACVNIPCELTVDKSVTCLSGCPNGAPVGGELNSLMAVPGACLQYKITATNVGSVNVPRVCITDTLTCDWTVSNITAVIGAVNVFGDLAGLNTDGVRTCFTFPSTPGGAGIQPGQSLVITFNLQIPANFPVANQAVDCRNTVIVEGYESLADDTSFPGDDSCRGSDSADVDVKVPRIDCQKQLQVDLGDNGTIDVPFTNAATISTPSYPMRITYSLTARNTGELPLSNVQICDTNLVAHAKSVGIAVGPCDLCNDPACDGAGDTCASVGALAPGAAATRTCQLVVADQAQWDAFAALDGIDGRNDCYSNAMRARGDVTPPCAPPNFPTFVESPGCNAILCITTLVECPVTKAKFDIWNQNETRFSGTERCIVSWDQTMLSQYTNQNIANHFRRQFLQTNKGMARIDGIASSVVCGDESVSAPLLGVAAKLVLFGQAGVDWAGMTVIGSGTEVGVIKYDPVDPFRGSDDGGIRAAGPAVLPRGTSSEKGSLVVFTKVELKWDPNQFLIQDTFLSLINDTPDDVRVQLYFVNGDQPTAPVFIGGVLVERGHPGCNAVDVETTLTGDEPTYWSAFSGLPEGVSPFTILDPGFPFGRPDNDPRNPGGRVLRGYVLGWAVNAANQEIHWNHLTGSAVIVNYLDQSAWEYNTWNFAAVAAVNQGDTLLNPLGQLDLDGVEYDFAPDRLILDFYASGAIILSSQTAGFLVDTDLTLWAALKDLRSP